MRVLKEEQDKKVKEIENIINNYTNSYSEKYHILDKFFDKGFIKITPPEEEEEQFIQFITLDSKFSKNGVSRKPGNIVLNIKNLIKSVPDLISAMHDLSNTDSDKYLLAIRLGIITWSTLWNTSKIDINKDSSIVLYTFWTNCNNNHEIKQELAYSRVNDTREALRIGKLSIEEYNNIVNCLSKIKCLKINDGMIKLVEGVKIKY